MYMRLQHIYIYTSISHTHRKTHSSLEYLWVKQTLENIRLMHGDLLRISSNLSDSHPPHPEKRI